MEKVPTNKELKSNNKNKKTIVVGGDAIPTYDGFDFPPENCKEFEVLNPKDSNVRIQLEGTRTPNIATISNIIARAKENGTYDELVRQIREAMAKNKAKQGNKGEEEPSK